MMRATLMDPVWGERRDPSVFGVAVIEDRPPMVAITRPGRDAQVRPDDAIGFEVAAHDDVGIGRIELVGRASGSAGSEPGKPTVLHTWAIEGRTTRQATRSIERTVEALGLASGEALTYWAVAVDRNTVGPDAPGRAVSRKYQLRVLSAAAASERLEDQLVAYSRAVAELIKLQQRNRAESAEHRSAGPLIERQAVIRSRTRGLASLMEREGFPGRTIIEQLRALAATPMVEAISMLERYRDAASGRAAGLADESLPVQDRIIAELEAIQRRLDRNVETRRRLRRAEQAEPKQHERVEAVINKLAADLDDFLGEMKEIEEKYEKMPARGDEQLTAEQLEALEDVEHRLDRWKKWSKDSVDAITKLPEGFVPDSHLADNVSTIFEEIEKQERSPTREIATPMEEGIKALAEEVAEDLEMWMPDSADSKKWVMEDPAEGKFEVPEMELPSKLQDMIGDLVEEVDEFDEEADDITGAWGGNMQVGWAIDDGPISSFAAKGKTGNQLPNASEMGGRSGAGRRGRSSGQMVGGESRALEGRPTPARVTNEPYEQGAPDAKKQLDPRGATGGGKKTGGGQKGLQGFNPPDFVKDMERLSEQQKMLREQAQAVAREMQRAGRPLTSVQRAIELMGESGEDLRDLRYRDAARKRKAALAALRAAEREAEAGVTLELQRARELPAELREQISSGSRKALPEGYEDLVGAYYRALSEEADE